MTGSRKESRRRLALVGLSLGYFMVLFDTTALTVALPDLARHFDTGVQSLAWVTDAYTLTFAGCLLAGGIVADRRGADRIFLVGLSAFAALSLCCAVAPSLPSLVAARALLGVSGALLLPSSLSLVAALHPDAGPRARAISAWAAISATALAAGPLLGGILVAAAGWRGIFVVNAPVAVVAALLLRGRVPAVGRRSVAADWRGQTLVFVAVAGLTTALIRGPGAGWSTAAALGVAVLAAALAFGCERRSSTPAVPAALLRSRRFVAALIAGFAIGGVLAGELFLATLQLQELRGFGPILAGAAFLPLTVPMVVNPPLAGRLVARVGPRGPVLGGLLLVTAATAVLALLPGDVAFVWFGCALVAIGFGFSLTLPSLTAAAVIAAPSEVTGTAGGIFSVGRQIGATVGVAAAAAAIDGDIGRFARGQTLLAIAAAAGTVAWVGLSKGRAPSPRDRAPVADGEHFREPSEASPGDGGLRPSHHG